MLSPVQLLWGCPDPAAVRAPLAAAPMAVGGKKKKIHIFCVATATSSSCLPQTSEPTQEMLYSTDVHPKNPTASSGWDAAPHHALRMADSPISALPLRQSP